MNIIMWSNLKPNHIIIFMRTAFTAVSYIPLPNEMTGPLMLE